MALNNNNNHTSTNSCAKRRKRTFLEKDGPTAPVEDLSSIQRVITETLDPKVTNEMMHDIRPLKSSNKTVSSSRLQLNVVPHPLRWNRLTNAPRYTAHKHPLRLVHTDNIYPEFRGRWVCDIHEGGVQPPAYTFHCPICEFDICLACVAQSCFNCSPKDCYHTRIYIDMI